MRAKWAVAAAIGVGIVLGQAATAGPTGGGLLRRIADPVEDTTVYMVVVNHEEQYSIWPEHRQIPLGWKDVGKHGTKAECLDYIKEVWTDMRPQSLRKKMDAASKQQ